MPYRVLDNEEMNWADNVSDHGSYPRMLEAACDYMEKQGYRLVAIQEDGPDAGGPYFHFYREY